MKFSDGFWLMRAGVHASHPAEVLDGAATAGPGSLLVYAPTRRIRHRGDLLTGPAVTLSCTAPMPEVIGVEIIHFAGGTPQEPQFQLLPGAAGETAEPTGRTGPVIRVAAVGAPAPGRWQVLLAGIHAVGAVTGGTATAHPHGSLITASGAGLEIRLTAR